MFEILIFIASVAGLGTQARHRGMNAPLIVAGAVAGWLFLLLLVPVPAGILFRWGWLGLFYILVEVGNRGATVSVGSWQCPDCRLFNEGDVPTCLCGYQHPKAS